MEENWNMSSYKNLWGDYSGFPVYMKIYVLVNMYLKIIREQFGYPDTRPKLARYEVKN